MKRTIKIAALAIVFTAAALVAATYSARASVSAECQAAPSEQTCSFPLD